MTTAPNPNAVITAPAPTFPVSIPPWALDLVGQLPAAMKAAELIIAAGMAPKGYDKPQQIIVACAMGARLGLDPFASLAGISVINNRPCVWGDAMLAVCQNHPAWGGMKIERSGEGDSFAVRVTVHRKGQPEPVDAEFTMADAIKAGLKGKQGPWSQYPKRMVEQRAKAFALRTAFADALAGFHSREEMEDSNLVDVTATAVVHPEPVKAKRRTVTAEATPAAVQPPATEPEAPASAQEQAAEEQAPAAGKAEPSPEQKPAEPRDVSAAACRAAMARLWKTNGVGKTKANEILEKWNLREVAELASCDDAARAEFLDEVEATIASIGGGK